MNATEKTVERLSITHEVETLFGSTTQYLPHFLWTADRFTAEQARKRNRLLTRLIQRTLRLFIYFFLRPRKGSPGSLDAEEVESVYTREARTYDLKHHLTTHGMDTTWRRQAGWHLISVVRKSIREHIRVLDLCTGTGLTVCEMENVLNEWDMPTPVDIVGLDYNKAMLEKAEARSLSGNHINVAFVRGDATNMVSTGEFPLITSGGLHQFPEKHFGFISQVFGIGGIKQPDKVFEGVLQLLEKSGRYFLIDMHRPIARLPGEYFFFGWRQMPNIEAQTYEETTIPLALRRLWGWRDTTLDFYLLPLITYRSEDGKCWGFSVLSLDVQSEHWWLGLPVMPVARTLVEKVEITEQEAKKRISIRAWLKNAVSS